ncbi:MAG TPA: hypothetical protein VFC19_27215 [Candidatus Limnocylindrales bacterium]|nr:hypothetical protein [Candidatus Limnocylindrales bacterium]
MLKAVSTDSAGCRGQSMAAAVAVTAVASAVTVQPAAVGRPALISRDLSTQFLDVRAMA